MSSSPYWPGITPLPGGGRVTSSGPALPTAGIEDGDVLTYNAAEGKWGAARRSAVLPSGVIIMWSGQESQIPQGWQLCDGTNGTPDLSSLFIIEE